MAFTLAQGVGLLDSGGDRAIGASELGISLSHATLDQPRAIAEAFILGADFIGSDLVVLVLGDNFFYGVGLTRLGAQHHDNAYGKYLAWLVTGPGESGGAV